MRRRRVMAGLAALAAALSIPAVAIAAAINLHGPAGTGAGDQVVDLTVVVAHGHVVKVVRFTFANVPVACTGFSSTALSSAFPHHMLVRHGRFHGVAKLLNGRTTYTVSGRFKNTHRGSGTLRITGTVPACRRGDSGTVRWSAH